MCAYCAVVDGAADPLCCVCACVRVRNIAVRVLRSEARIRQVHACGALYNLDDMQHLPQCAAADVWQLHTMASRVKTRQTVMPRVFY